MTNEERALDAVAHLQTAALEMIAAARAVLDVAEDLVKDPAPIIAMAAAAAAQGRRMADAATPASPTPGSPDSGAGGETGYERPARVQHIAVS